MSALHEIFSRLARVEKLVRRVLSVVYRDPTWLTQTVWHIDFDNGNDTADGKTLATALLTFGELLRRVGDDFDPQQDVDVYCYGDNKQTDPLRIKHWYVRSPQPGTILRRVRFHGPPPIVYYSGVMSAVQVRAQATNTPFVITDVNAIGANQTPPVPPPNDQARWWNPILDPFGRTRGANHDFQRLRIVSGPRSGAMSWTSVGNGVTNNRPWAINGNIRTTNWVIPVPFGYTAGFATVGVTQIVPQAGDHYVIERMGKLYLEHAVVEGNDDFGGSGVAFSDFQIELLEGFDSQGVWTQPTLLAAGGSLTFVNCFFDSVVSMTNIGGGLDYLVNCIAIDTIISAGGINYMDAGGAHLGITVQGTALGGLSLFYVDAGVMVETGILAAVGLGAYLSIGDACAFDQPGHGYRGGAMAFDGGTIATNTFNFYGLTALWGVDDDAQTRKYGVSVFDSGRWFVDPTVMAHVTIAGHLSDFNIGKSERDGDKARTIDPSTGIVTEAGGVPTRACSFAHIFQTIALGGFGGRVVDMETLAVITQQDDRT